jgi:hypothetical protein
MEKSENDIILKLKDELKIEFLENIEEVHKLKDIILRDESIVF